MSFKASGAPRKSDVLRQVFAVCSPGISAALGGVGISLRRGPALHQDVISFVADDADRYEARLKDKCLWTRYGAGASVFHAFGVPIMAHLPVSLSVFHEDQAAYGGQLANALYAIAVAFAYLQIHAEDADDVVTRLTIHLMAGHAPLKVEANLAALRGFLDAYVQKKLFIGPRVLRERLAIA